MDILRNFEFIYQVSQWWVAIALLLVQVIAGILGYLLGKKREHILDDEAKAYVGVLGGVLFSLLTLTMSFTLAFTLNRYETRRQAIVQEANTIGTTFLRSLTLPEPYREITKGKLRQYTDNRDELYAANPGTAAFREVLTKTDDLHVSLWRDIERLTLDYPEARFTELYQISLNEMIDAHGTRVAALAFRLPEVVLWLLMSLAVFANFAMGYSRGLAGSRQIASQLFITLIMVIMNMVIMDADRPRRGLIQVPNTPISNVESLIDTFYGTGWTPPKARVLQREATEGTSSTKASSSDEAASTAAPQGGDQSGAPTEPSEE